jgi:hypothetical protein
VADEFLEAEAVEESASELTSAADQGEVRPLPEPVRGAELEAWRDDARTVAVAAAGGLLIGAATVATVKAALAARGAASGLSWAARRRRSDRGKVVASRSFLVDIHVLGR